MKYTLTGKFYHKKTLFGLVLMVEITYKEFVNYGGYVGPEEDIVKYVKAKERDLAKLKLATAAATETQF